MIETAFFVEPASWQFDQDAIRAVRTEVFIVEQRVPEEEEWDDDDGSAQHFLALSSEREAIGTARLTADGRIGRVAVMKAWRGVKVGDALMRAAMEFARNRSMPELKLAAQTYALAFYQRHGFEPFGELFQDAGIEHRWMRRSLDAPAPPQPPSQARATPRDQTPSRVDFGYRQDLLQAWARQISHCRRHLCIFSQTLDLRVLDQPLIMDELRALAVSNLKPSVQILVLDSKPAVATSHPLIALAQRLPSVIEIRRPGRDHRDYPGAFSIADEHHLLLRAFGDQFEGYSLLWQRRHARRQQEIFSAMWETASPDPQCRRLGL
ncbi:MAG: GNAT family N-acetyltransferase [Lysobacterales bacterium]